MDLFSSLYFRSVPICVIFSGPCMYIWLNFWSSVDEDIYDQYKFGCISIVVSCIIEVLVETPVFVAQVFCFVKFRVVLDTLHIFVRSTIFIWLILRDPKQAIFAFSIAQIGSTIVYFLGYYGYFYYYIRNLNALKAAKKRSDDITPDDKPNASDDGIPFNSISQMVPGCLPNSVSIYLRFEK